ncbi:MAG: DUF4157 domain-containing protein [Myxococcota bacterium]|nr:DUF4157 domain-containing protein [Myxococcota bacterium]
MSELGHAPPASDAAHTHESKDAGATVGAGTAIAAAAAEPAGASSGRGLDPTIQAKMEGAFGADFSAVKVHTDGPANEAAQNLNAKAFAQGSDVFFNEGQYDPGSEGGETLIAHELAHVVQTGGDGGVAQPKAKDGATSVSSPGESSETAADAAADKAVKGEAVGSVGSAPSSTLHRDALGDLESAASGNWLGSVDGARVLARVAALTPADKAALRTGSKYDSLNRRVMKKLSTGQCLEYLNIVGGLDLRWKLYWLNEGGQLDELVAAQWQWLIGYASPQHMDLLRAYPTGYKAFLKNAPLEMIPPWDRLQGLEDGTWTGTATDIRNAVVNLNADQKARVRADNGKMAKIMKACGDAVERFRVVTYLELKVKWAVFWLDSVKQVPALEQHQWSQLLSEASRADYDELVGWAGMWALVQQHCPAAVLQVTRQNSDPATAVKAFEDPVQIQTLFSTLGPAGFLATAVKDPTMVDDVYQKLKGNKVVPTVEGLPTGAQLGAAAKASLRQWMFTRSSDDAECQAMFERRFRVQVHGLGTYDHLHKTNDDGTKVRNNVDLQPFTKAGLTQMWTVCETLPPSAVENNLRLMNILRNQANGPGNAYYAGPGTGGQGDILMGYGAGGDAKQAGGTADDDLATNVGSNSDYVYQAGGVAPGSPAVNMPMFNATLRHEIGHAVDSQLNVMATWGRQETAGGWTKYPTWTAWIDAIIAAGGGMNYGSKTLNDQYRQGMIDAVSGATKISFSQALTNKGITPPAADPGGPVAAVWETGRWTGQPWYDQSWKTQGTRNFQCAYGGESTLYSFLAAAHDNKKVTAYQWRAPAEWFAECYQVYYAETESGPGTAVGGMLRAKDPDAAQMISQVCDRGYSPQQMNGAGTATTPGT